MNASVEVRGDTALDKDTNYSIEKESTHTATDLGAARDLQDVRIGMMPTGWPSDPTLRQQKRIQEQINSIRQAMAAEANDVESFMEDESTPSSGLAGTGRSNSQDDDGVAASSGKAKQTLKRGDACLYCRRRRIRCTAEKPACAHCVKVGKSCEYDTGKPRSRVKQLEEKINELESRLLTKSQPAPSFAGPSAPAPGPRPMQTTTESFSSSSTSFNSSNSQPFSSSAFFDPNTSSAPTPGFAPFDFNNIIPTPGLAPNMIFEPQATPFSMDPSYKIPRGFQEPLPDTQVDFDFAFLDSTMMDLSAGMNSFEVQSQPQPQEQSQKQPEPQHFGPSPGSLGTGTGSGSGSGSSPYGDTTWPSNGENPTDYAGGDLYETRFLNKPRTYPPSGSQPKLQNLCKERDAPDPEWSENTVLGNGGMSDPNDIPPQARDHLLDMFFSKRRLFGFECHIPRFYASLTLPPSRRPHPCLLNAMYLMAARTSTSPAINALEKRFFDAAAAQLDEAITKSDRLFDALRATTLLCVYQYSHARYHQAWVTCGTAVRLVYSTGLNAIPSSVWKPTKVPSDLAGLMRVRDYVLPPPSDSVELAERIYAFWAIFHVDRAGSIATTWPNGIHDNEIVTPFPRPLIEYELGLVSRQDDVSIGSLYEFSDSPSRAKPIQDSMFTSTTKALAFLDRASKLVYLRPEKGTDFYSPQRCDGPSPADDSPAGYTLPKIEPAQRTASIRTPAAFASLKNAIDRFNSELPPDRRNPWESWDGKIDRSHMGTLDPEVAQLHFIIGAAQMFMYDIFSYNHENAEALAIARRMVAVIYLVNQQRMSDLGVFVVMIWSFVCKLLIREVKRLQTLNNYFAAAAIEAEVELVVDALKRIGRVFGIATMQADRMGEYMQSDLADYKFMEGDGYWDDSDEEPHTAAVRPT